MLRPKKTYTAVSTDVKSPSRYPPIFSLSDNYHTINNTYRVLTPYKFQRQSEHHLFKWIDEAIIDEIRMVDKKVTHLQSDFQSIKRTTTMRLQEHGKKIDESLLEMKRIFHDQTILLEELRNKSTSVLDAKSHCPLLNVAAAAIALGTLAWLYAKMTSI